jgi:hypothetical protein
MAITVGARRVRRGPLPPTTSVRCELSLRKASYHFHPCHSKGANQVQANLGWMD